MKIQPLNFILPLGLSGLLCLGSLTTLSAEETAAPAKPATTQAPDKPNPDQAKETKAKMNKAMQAAQKDPAVAAAFKEAKKKQLKKAMEIDPSLSEMIGKELAKMDKVDESKKPKDSQAPKEPKKAKDKTADAPAT